MYAMAPKAAMKTMSGAIINMTNILNETSSSYCEVELLSFDRLRITLSQSNGLEYKHNHNQSLHLKRLALGQLLDLMPIEVRDFDVFAQFGNSLVDELLNGYILILDEWLGQQLIVILRVHGRYMQGNIMR